jgi:hypothetical protein
VPITAPQITGFPKKPGHAEDEARINPDLAQNWKIPMQATLTHAGDFYLICRIPVKLLS